MKYLLSLLLAPALFYGQTEKSVASDISTVTVFESGAQINRTATADVKPGEQLLIFRNVSPRLNEESLQIEQNGGLDVLNLEHQIQYLSDNQALLDSLKMLNQKLEATGKDMERTENKLRTNILEEKVLLANSKFGSESNNAANLQAGLNLVRNQMRQILSEREALLNELEEKEKELQRVSNELLQKRIRQSQIEGQVHVLVNSPTAKKVNFTLKYTVDDAGWSPVYDIKMNGLNKPLQISYKANVFQATGSNWKDVKLILNSGNPSSSLNEPNLRPFEIGNLAYNTGYRSNNQNRNIYLGFTGKLSGIVSDQKTNRGLENATILIYDSRGQAISGTSTDASGQFEISLKQPASSFQVLSVGYVPNRVSLNTNQRFYSLELRPGESTISVLSDDIQNMAARDISSVAAQSAGVTSATPNVRGARSNGTEYFIDGVKVRGDVNLPGASIAESDLLQEVVVAKSGYKHGNFSAAADELNLNFEVSTPYSIPSDGQPKTVMLQGFEADANYDYVAIPKLESNAYLSAKLGDWEKLNLLSGKLNLYLNEVYLGESELNLQQTDDTLTIPLGADERVITNRNLVKTDESKNLFSGRVTKTFSYKLNVRNNRAEVLSVNLEDQIPISRSADIKVEVINLNGAKMDTEYGQLTWNLIIPAGSQKEVSFSYQVSYPGTIQINH